LKRFSYSKYNRDKLEHKIDYPIEGLDMSKFCLGGVAPSGDDDDDDGDDDDDDDDDDDNEDEDDDDCSEHNAAEREIELSYDLVAVSEHHGGLGGGHYTAVGRSTVDGKWYSFDDSHVSETNNIVTPSAYVLFYVRKDLLEDYLNKDWSNTSVAEKQARHDSDATESVKNQRDDDWCDDETLDLTGGVFRPGNIDEVDAEKRETESHEMMSSIEPFFEAPILTLTPTLTMRLTVSPAYFPRMMTSLSGQTQDMTHRRTRILWGSDLICKAGPRE